MSFYDMMFEKNPISNTIRATLGLKEEDFGRYRDCFITEGTIAVYTRNGGGNREEYQPVIDALKKHPCYLYDKDDDFDCTYCTIYFKFPEEFADELKGLDTGEVFNPSERWKKLIASIEEEAKNKDKGN